MNITRQSSGKRHNMRSIDRLSALPDDVICHILSFLETKSSVATGILSRRWRFLWAHVPNLDFVPRCSKIVTRVMFRHRVQSLDTFRLFYTFAWNDHEIETWITTAVSRNVKNIAIKLYYQPVLHVCLFTCKTLIDLSLDEICLSVVLNVAVCLPCLKKLRLNSIRLDGDESLPRLLSGCPVLEELILDGIIDCKSICCNISSPTIKRLEVVFCQFNGFGVHRDCRLEINTPALRYLQLNVHSFNAISAQMLPSLIEADIRSNVVLDFLDDLNNVKCLKYVQPVCVRTFTVSFCILLVLPIVIRIYLSITFCSFPTECLVIKVNRLQGLFSASTIKFDNLTKLELACDWRFLSYFLENADNLEVIIFCKQVDIDLNCWMEPRQVPACLLSHLRTVRIDQFGSTEQVFMMVKYILRNAKVLEKMEIYSEHHGTDFKAKFDALKRISTFQRGSEACELVFH
ncbi:hypothetical protein DH2020_011652 [Rehmannia glutinosa]|uniref:F-box domain-containing protein n=1 Tax=Rehmannia glutinosa TaxID=99300 RepID=A0ABR0XE44_REHGL